MSELLTAAQMRAIEQAAIASGAVTGLELMERAGRGVVEAVFAQWPELRATSHRAAVLCGPGNNGGDGFVVARLLREWGWEVEVFLQGAPEGLPPDARANLDRWRGMGEVTPLSRIGDFGLGGPGPDVLIDALFGAGLNRPLPEEVGRVLQGIEGEAGRRMQGSRVVAVDLPSGLCADSGRALGRVLRAALTVTFHRAKCGHHLAEGPALCGRVVTVDIGLPPRPRFAPVPPQVVQLARAVPARLARRGGHKFANGHALVLAGGRGQGGAARLAARGALRIGAGVVTVGCPPGAMAENAARLDAVMLRAVPDGPALARVLEDQRINALCVGPGMGLDARGREVVGMALKCRSEARPAPVAGRGSDRLSVVLDADALTILSQAPDLFAALHGACVLTPHGGEFARLFPDVAERLAAPATSGPACSKVDATREAAARAGCVVLFKGPDTVIADPSGRCAIHSAHYDRAAPWLATAGAGDVLAGFICGLMARGFAPFDAACTGAWLHVECALSFGPGLIAEDLPDELPRVFRALGI